MKLRNLLFFVHCTLKIMQHITGSYLRSLIMMPLCSMSSLGFAMCPEAVFSKKITVHRGEKRDKGEDSELWKDYSNSRSWKSWSFWIITYRPASNLYLTLPKNAICYFGRIKLSDIFGNLNVRVNDLRIATTLWWFIKVSKVRSNSC